MAARDRVDGFALRHNDGVPPSQLQFCGGGADWRGCDELWIEPVTSWRAGG